MTGEEVDALINALARDAGLPQDGAATCAHRRTGRDRHSEPTSILSAAGLNAEVVVPVAPPARLRARILAAARADHTKSGRSSAGAETAPEGRGRPAQTIAEKGEGEVRSNAVAGCHMSVEVLVADDDAAIRTVIAAVLEDEGYRVCLAVHGREALDRIAEHPRWRSRVLERPIGGRAHWGDHGGDRVVIGSPGRKGWDGIHRLVRRYRRAAHLDGPDGLGVEASPIEYGDALPGRGLCPGSFGHRAHRRGPRTPVQYSPQGGGRPEG